jgi:WD40 repeat protein
MEIFYCYSSSSEDQNLQKELAQQLVPLKRRVGRVVITDWNYSDILAGTEREQEIYTHLKLAEIILLLVSPDFLASDSCNNQVKLAMDRYEAGKAIVIPIILRACDWKGELFGKLQALPKDNKPIIPRENKDKVFFEIAKEIERTCKFYQYSSIQEQQKARDTQIAQAAKIAQKLSTNRPIDGLILAIKIAGEISNPSEIMDYLRDRLLEAIEVAREQNMLDMLDHPGGEVHAVDVSPNGDYIVTGGQSHESHKDGIIRLWNHKGELIQELSESDQKSVNSVAFSPDGNYIISGGKDKMMRLWDLNGNVVSKFKEEAYINSVAVNYKEDKQSYYIAIGCANGYIRFLEFQIQNRSIKLRDNVQGYEDNVNVVYFSSDGNYLISGGSSSLGGGSGFPIKIWRINFTNGSLESIKNLSGHTEFVNSVALSPEKKYIVSGSADDTIRLWKVSANMLDIENELEIPAHEDNVMCVAFHPTKHLFASGSADATIRLWDFEGNLIDEPLLGHRATVRSIAFSRRDGSVLVSGDDQGKVRFWDMKDSEFILPFRGHMSAVNSVVFGLDKEQKIIIVSASMGWISKGGTIRLWDLDGKPMGDPFKGHKTGIRTVAFSPQGDCIASCGDDSTVRLWDLSGNQIIKDEEGNQTIGEQENTFKGHSGSVRFLTFSPQGDYIVSVGTDKTIRFWNLDGNQRRGALKYPNATLRSLALNPTNSAQIVSCSDDGKIQIWNTDRDNEMHSIDAHSQAVRSIAFNSKGDKFATGSSDCTIKLWDHLNRRQIGKDFEGHEGIVRSVVFSPTEDLIASCSDDGTIRLWDLDGNQKGDPFKGHEHSVRSIAFSPDGKYIVSGSADKTIKLWNVDNGSLAVTPQDIREEWLKVACNRLRYHPALNNPEKFYNNPDDIEIAKQACEICRQSVWEKSEESTLSPSS